MTGKDALAQLGLAEDASPADVKRRYHERAFEVHPDHGGTEAAMHELQTWYRVAYVYASKPKLCPDCGGDGYLEVRRGVRVLGVRCATCRGRGELDPTFNRKEAP